jgi:hypothetical protein
MTFIAGEQLRAGDMVCIHTDGKVYAATTSVSEDRLILSDWPFDGVCLTDTEEGSALKENDNV